MKPWTEEFDGYTAATGEGTLEISLDMGAACRAPLEGFSKRLILKTEEDQQGCSPGLLEARLRSALNGGRAQGLLYLGRFTLEGSSGFLFYAAEQASLSPTELLGQALTGVSFEIEAAEDPDWRFYFDILFPDIYHYEVMQNRRSLASLAECGDDGRLSRLLTHFAYFMTPECAEEAMADLIRLGYRREAVQEVPTAERADSRYAYLLLFSRVDMLSSGHIDEVCFEILDVLLPKDGIYDGWESQYSECGQKN